MNAFHVCGAILAGWAVIVAVVGITRENFPTSEGSARVISSISLILVAAAIGTAIYTSATEEQEDGEGEPEEAALLVAPV